MSIEIGIGRPDFWHEEIKWQCEDGKIITRKIIMREGYLKIPKQHGYGEGTWGCGSSNIYYRPWDSKSDFLPPIFPQLGSKVLDISEYEKCLASYNREEGLKEVKPNAAQLWNEAKKLFPDALPDGLPSFEYLVEKGPGSDWYGTIGVCEDCGSKWWAGDLESYK